LKLPHLHSSVWFHIRLPHTVYILVHPIHLVITYTHPAHTHHTPHTARLHTHWLFTFTVTVYRGLPHYCVAHGLVTAHLPHGYLHVYVLQFVYRFYAGSPRWVYAHTGLLHVRFTTFPFGSHTRFTVYHGLPHARCRLRFGYTLLQRLQFTPHRLRRLHGCRILVTH